MNGKAKHYSLDQLCDEKRTLNSQKRYVAANVYTRGILWPSKYDKICFRPGLRRGPR